MQTLESFIFYLPRVISVFISLIVFAFFTEAMVSLNSNAQLIANVVGLIVGFAIVFLAFYKRHLRTLMLLPLAYWLSLVLYFFQGGFVSSLNFIQFGFLSLLAGLITGLSYYAWYNYKIGGVIYCALGVIYFLMTLRQLPLYAIAFVLFVLCATGIMYYFTPAHQIPPKDDHDSAESGWQSLSHHEES